MYFEMLKSDREFKYIYSKGKSFANKKLVLYYIYNKNAAPKVGISVSKKVGKAVKRNYLRRIIKENLRNKFELKKNISIILIVRVGADDLNYDTMGKSMNHIFKKCGLLENKRGDDKDKIAVKISSDAD